MKQWVLSLDQFRKLCKSCQQDPHARIHMDKESDPPMIDADVLLFDPEKADICVIRDISNRYPGHQPGKESQGQQKAGIEDVGAADNLFYF